MSLRERKGSLLCPTLAGLGLVAGSDSGICLVATLGGGQDPCGQATKGMWGMSWRQEAMKGVEDCDKPGEAVTRALIPGYPNNQELNP